MKLTFIPMTIAPAFFKKKCRVIIVLTTESTPEQFILLTELKEKFLKPGFIHLVTLAGEFNPAGGLPGD